MRTKLHPAENLRLTRTCMDLPHFAPVKWMLVIMSMLVMSGCVLDRNATMAPNAGNSVKLSLYIEEGTFGLGHAGVTLSTSFSAELNLNNNKQSYTIADLDTAVLNIDKAYDLSALTILIKDDTILINMIATNESESGRVNYFNGKYRYTDSYEVRRVRKKAETGDSEAQKMLGICYERGEGVSKNVILAYKWYELSSSQNNQEAAKLKETLSVKMTPAEITEAQRLSREWMPTKGKE